MVRDVLGFREEEDLQADIAKHSAKLEATLARSIILDGEISAIQSGLGPLWRRQFHLDTMRAEEREIFATAKADLEQGILGVQKASYYGASFVQQPADPEVYQSPGGPDRHLLGCSRLWKVIFRRTCHTFPSNHHDTHSSCQVEGGSQLLGDAITVS